MYGVLGVSAMSDSIFEWIFNFAVRPFTFVFVPHINEVVALPLTTSLRSRQKRLQEGAVTALGRLRSRCLVSVQSLMFCGFYMSSMSDTIQKECDTDCGSICEISLQ